MRRTLPFQRDDLPAILAWCAGDQDRQLLGPSGAITRALERFAASTPTDAELRAAMRRFAARLRNSYKLQATRLATTVEQLRGAERGWKNRLRLLVSFVKLTPLVGG